MSDTRWHVQHVEVGLRLEDLVPLRLILNLVGPPQSAPHVVKVSILLIEIMCPANLAVDDAPIKILATFKIGFKRNRLISTLVLQDTGLEEQAITKICQLQHL
jgi:hypothetical protein